MASGSLSEVPVPKSEVPNFDTSYVWCFLLLRSYLCVFLSLCYSINGAAPKIGPLDSGATSVVCTNAMTVQKTKVKVGHKIEITA